MQYDGRCGSDLLLGEVYHDQRSPGGRTHSCKLKLSLPEFIVRFIKNFFTLFRKPVLARSSTMSERKPRMKTLAEEQESFLKPGRS